GTDTTLISESDDSMDTIRVSDSCSGTTVVVTFLASLTSTQDECYSNQAWAIPSGLPPRAVGRCERALGDALYWRL
ncbi:hypothetical protein FB446DRAFT_608510, partial [Lentinula raphanica]